MGETTAKACSHPLWIESVLDWYQRLSNDKKRVKEVEEEMYKEYLAGVEEKEIFLKHIWQ